MQQKKTGIEKGCKIDQEYVASVATRIRRPEVSLLLTMT